MKSIRFVFAAAVAVGMAMSSAANAGGPKNHTVKVISDYDNLRMYFKPKTLVVQPGDTVTWVNLAEEEHNVFSYPDGFPKGGAPMQSHYMQKKDESWSFTFKLKGTYEYHCIPHMPMGMHGSVIVAQASTDEEFHVPSKKELATYRGMLKAYFDDDVDVENRDERIAKQKKALAEKMKTYNPAK